VYVVGRWLVRQRDNRHECDICCTEHPAIKARDGSKSSARTTPVSGSWSGAASPTSPASSPAAPPPSSPLNTTVSGNRRFTVAGRTLEEYRLVRACYNYDVNDVVLAVVAGALRNWLLLSRGEPATPTSTVRGHGPDVGVSRHRTRLDRARSGHQRGVAVLATFPSGKTTPWCGCRRSPMPPNRTRPRPAPSTPGPSSRLLGFAPPTLHAMGIRIAGDVRGATAAAQPGAGDRCHVVVVSRRQRRPGSGERSRRAAEFAARIAR
jgi:Wax ester synthase/diacylglycerol acyltransferase catalytic domain